MKVDEFGLLVMEHVEAPGCYGDSCAETFRAICLGANLDPTLAAKNTCSQFGLLRHPLSPWRENDFSVDQWLPRFLGVRSVPYERHSMSLRITESNYKTGNGDFLSPLALAALYRWRRIEGTWLDIALVGQALLFKLPYRWNDEKRWFEKMSDSSADYLNWFIYLHHCHKTGHTFWSKLAKKMLTKEKLLDRVNHYYRNEPNILWLLDLYKKAAKEVFK